MTLTSQEFIRLQKLACIKLSSEEEAKLSNQLQNIILFLNSLNEIKITETSGKSGHIENSLRTLTGIKVFDDNQALLKNVKHEKINNSIVIKSVLS